MRIVRTRPSAGYYVALNDPIIILEEPAPGPEYLRVRSADSNVFAMERAVTTRMNNVCMHLVYNNKILLVYLVTQCSYKYDFIMNYLSNS